MSLHTAKQMLTVNSMITIWVTIWIPFLDLSITRCVTSDRLICCHDDQMQSVMLKSLGAMPNAQEEPGSAHCYPDPICIRTH